MVLLVPGWLREKDGVESERVRAERGGHSRQRVQPGKGSWEGKREGAKDGGCLEVKHLTVREPQGFGSEDALKRGNVSPLSHRRKLGLFQLGHFHQQSDQLPPRSLPAPGPSVVGCVSRGWAPSRAADQVPRFSSPRRSLRSDQRTAQSGRPSVPRARPAAAGGRRQARSAPPLAVGGHGRATGLRGSGPPLRGAAQSRDSTGSQDTLREPRACSDRPAASALSEASSVWFLPRRLGSWLRRRPPTAT